MENWKNESSLDLAMCPTDVHHDTPQEILLAWRIGVALALLWLAICLPLLLGFQTLFFRDVFNFFLPLKVFGAAQLAQGAIPMTNPTWALGAPFAGTPNSSAFYPGNVLYLVLPPLLAFNVHFVLHWGGAALTMGLLARRLGQSPVAAVLAGAVYASSGWMLSALTFYNIIAIAAWAPLILLGAAIGGVNGVLLGGLSCAMAILAGEPVTLALVLGVAVLLMFLRHGLRHGLALLSGTAAVAAIGGLPQIVATLHVVGTSSRWRDGFSEGAIAHYRAGPLRFLELLVPFPFGRAVDGGVLGVWDDRVLSHVPFNLSFHFGIVALLLACAAVRAQRWPLLVGAAGLLISVLPDRVVPLVKAITLGIVQSPEKGGVLLALSLPLMAGWGLDRLRSRQRMPVVALWLLAAGVVLAVILAELRRASSVAVYSRLDLLGQGAVALLLLGCCALAWKRSRPGLMIGLQLLAVAQLRPLWLVDSADVYREPAGFSRAVSPGSAVVPTQLIYPGWTESIGSELEVELVRANAALLGQGPGILHGFTYPAGSDLDGMNHQRYAFLMRQLASASWPARVEWLRRMGAQVFASLEELPEGELWRLVALQGSADLGAFLYQIHQPSPLAWWPERLLVTPSARESFELLSEAENRAASVAPLPIVHGRGSVEVIVEGTDRLELRTRGEGGLVVVRRIFQPFWKARTTGGSSLTTLPVDVTLLGVIVPAGEQTVVLEVDDRPELLAMLVSVLGISGLVAWWWWRNASRRSRDR